MSDNKLLDALWPHCAQIGCENRCALPSPRCYPHTPDEHIASYGLRPRCTLTEGCRMAHGHEFDLCVKP